MAANPTAVVIGCGSAKLDRAAPAKDLYTGSLFRAARAAAESTGLPWFILSAKHGLVTPDAVLAPYDATIRTAYDHTRASHAVRDTAGALPPPRVYIEDGKVRTSGVAAWCAARYVEALVDAGVHVASTPLAGLGIGKRIQWLTREAKRQAA